MKIKEPAHCTWCGAELPETIGRGRRRKYCSDSCKQRAYEHRHQITQTRGAGDVEHMSKERTERLRDRLFQLRCAAEDVAVAVDESADAAEIQDLCRELVTMAKEIERSY